MIFLTPVLRFGYLNEGLGPPSGELMRHNTIWFFRRLSAARHGLLPRAAAVSLHRRADDCAYLALQRRTLQRTAVQTGLSIQTGRISLSCLFLKMRRETFYGTAVTERVSIKLKALDSSLYCLTTASYQKERPAQV